MIDLILILNNQSVAKPQVYFTVYFIQQFILEVTLDSNLKLKEISLLVTWCLRNKNRDENKLQSTSNLLIPQVIIPQVCLFVVVVFLLFVVVFFSNQN